MLSPQLANIVRGQEEIKLILIAFSTTYIHHSIKVVYAVDEFYDGGEGMH